MIFAPTRSCQLSLSSFQGRQIEYQLRLELWWECHLCWMAGKTVIPCDTWLLYRWDTLWAATRWALTSIFTLTPFMTPTFKLSITRQSLFLQKLDLVHPKSFPTAFSGHASAKKSQSVGRVHRNSATGLAAVCRFLVWHILWHQVENFNYVSTVTCWWRMKRYCYALLNHKIAADTFHKTQVSSTILGISLYMHNWIVWCFKRTLW